MTELENQYKELRRKADLAASRLEVAKEQQTKHLKKLRDLGFSTLEEAEAEVVRLQEEAQAVEDRIREILNTL